MIDMEQETVDYLTGCLNVVAPRILNPTAEDLERAEMDAAEVKRSSVGYNIGVLEGMGQMRRRLN